jgi:hypothetical protein
MENPQHPPVFLGVEGVDKAMCIVMKFFSGQFSQTVVFETRSRALLNCGSIARLKISASSDKMENSCLFS